MALKCTNLKNTFENLGIKNVERVVLIYIKCNILQNIVKRGMASGENETE